ncbi:hypothetical protein LTR86_004090 [Recurvomyces mirabilis]|nr:hypothetical protein LTR86_004090 [Recurvomyces mirabilis]
MPDYLHQGLGQQSAPHSFGLGQFTQRREQGAERALFMDDSPLYDAYSEDMWPNTNVLHALSDGPHERITGEPDSTKIHFSAATPAGMASTGLPPPQPPSIDSSRSSSSMPPLETSTRHLSALQSQVDLLERRLKAQFTSITPSDGVECCSTCAPLAKDLVNTRKMLKFVFKRFQASGSEEAAEGGDLAEFVAGVMGNG